MRKPILNPLTSRLRKDPGKIVVAIALVAFALLYGFSVNPHLSAYDDNAAYILLTRGMIEDGSFSINLDGTPKLNTLLPPAFPVMLIPPYWLSGGSVVAMKAFVALTAVAAAGAFFILFRSILSPVQSLLLLLLFGFSRQIGMFANKVMTEAPFLLLLGAGLALAELYSRQIRWNCGVGIACAASLTLAAMTRTIGFSAGVAIAFYVFVQEAKKKNPRIGLAKAALIAAFVGTAQLLWFLRNLVIAGTPTNYVGHFMVISPTTAESPTIDPTLLALRLFDNLAYYLPLIAQSILSYRHSTLFPNWALTGVFSAVALIGVVYSIENRPSVIEWAWVPLFGVTLLWPWQTMRLVVPLLPFFMYYFVIGVSALAGSCGRLRSHLLRYLLSISFVAIPAYSLSTNLVGRGEYSLTHWALCLGAMGLIAVIFSRSRSRSLITAVLTVAGGSLICSSLIWHVQRNVIHEKKEPYYYLISDGWGEYNDIAGWLKENAPEESLVICRKPYLMRLWTDRRTSPYALTKNHEKLLQDLLAEENSLVIVDNFKWTQTTSKYLKPVIEANRPHFEEILAIGNSTVLRIQPDRSSNPDKATTIGG